MLKIIDAHPSWIQHNLKICVEHGTDHEGTRLAILMGIHMLLNALDINAKGHPAKIIIEEASIKLIPEP